MTHTPSSAPATSSSNPADAPPPPLLPSRPPLRLHPNSSEVLGFVLWLSSLLCFVAFLLWAYLPSSVLHSLSITYYPSHWWALAIPAYLSLLPLFIFTSYVAYNLHTTLPLTHPATLIDPHTRYPPPTHLIPPASLTPRYSIPPIYDMPLDAVNAYLYGTRATAAAGVG